LCGLRVHTNVMRPSPRPSTASPPVKLEEDVDGSLDGTSRVMQIKETQHAFA
jgi:hypothetical protein